VLQLRVWPNFLRRSRFHDIRSDLAALGGRTGMPATGGASGRVRAARR
jgi:hypothetical protein